ncbi:uncharacterized protein LOC120329368 [Styela clava]
MKICHLAIRALLMAITTTQVNSACVLGGLSPSLPDFCTMLYSAFNDWLSPCDDTTPEKHLRYDKTSSSWTYDCPCTKECQYGVDPGDIDTCPSCLLGPGETCDSWSGKCGDNLLCQHSGPMSSSGKCVSEEEFRSREIGEACGDWDGECKEGLRCKYDEDSAFLPPMFADMMHVLGECVTEETFDSQGEGEICSERYGNCSEGLACNEAMFPWSPNVCVNETNFNNTNQVDESILKKIFGDVNTDDVPFQGEIDIVLVEGEDADESKIILDMIDAIEHIIPDLVSKTDPETGETKVISIENKNGTLAIKDEINDNVSIVDADISEDKESDDTESYFSKIFDLAKPDNDKDDNEVNIGSDFEGFLNLLMSEEPQDSQADKNDFTKL